MSRGGGPKTGGRTKGTPNKRTLSLAEKLESLGLDIPQELFRLINQLDDITNPKNAISVINAKANILLELMQYLYPKRKSLDIDPGKISEKIQYIRLYDEESLPPIPQENPPST